LKDARKRFLGARPVKLHAVRTQGNAVLALSSRPWLSYCYQGAPHITSLSYQELEYASPFSSEQCPEGVVCVAGSTLRIVAIEQLGDVFNQTAVPLRYTPRCIIANEVNGVHTLITVESDHGSFSQQEREQFDAARKATLAMDDESNTDADAAATKAKKAADKVNGDGDDDDDSDSDDDSDDEQLDPELFIGRPKADDGVWGSCIRISR
jgi:splicing factor 3B subunit 3